MPTFVSTIKKELLSIQLLSITILVACLYLSLSVFLLNSRLFETLAASHTSVSEMTLLFLSLIGGLWTSLSLSDFILTILTAIFVGINLALLIKTIYRLENRGKIHFSVGGATILSLVASGCTSCGLSLLSILGLSASFSFLPFHGLELHIGSVLLLVFSTFYMLWQLHNGLYCKIPIKQ